MGRVTGVGTLGFGGPSGRLWGPVCNRRNGCGFSSVTVVTAVVSVL